MKITYSYHIVDTINPRLCYSHRNGYSTPLNAFKAGRSTCLVLFGNSYCIFNRRLIIRSHLIP